MPASSMITKVDGPTAAAQSGRSPCCRDQVSLARVSVRMPVCSREDGGCGRGRGEAEHLAAVLGPGQGEGAHGGGLPGAGRGDRQLQPGTGGAHLPDQGSLPGIQGGAVRRHLQQRQIDRRLRRRLPRRGVRRRRRGAARRRGSAARCRGRRRRRCRPTTRRPAAAPPVPRCRQPARPGQQTGDPAPHRPAGPPVPSACSAGTSTVRTWRCASARTCHICQVERLASITARM